VGALEVLGSRGVNEVLFEPGPRLLTALWEAAAIDMLVTVTAGGMAGEASPVLYEGAADTAGETLLHRMVPAQAGIVGDVAVTVWRPVSDHTDR
jgi:riboflavin biosynthesis pyrimidine reductase